MAVAAACLALLTACSPTVHRPAADDAANPECAAVIVRLPEVVAGLEARRTDAQATAAWGSPADVLLSCGVEVPAPTAELACFTVDGVDWLRDASDEPTTVFTTYGRDPATQLIINGATVNGAPVLSAVSAAVRVIPQERFCLTVDDVIEDGVPVPGGTPQPPGSTEPTPTPEPTG